MLADLDNGPGGLVAGNHRHAVDREAAVASERQIEVAATRTRTSPALGGSSSTSSNSSAAPNWRSTAARITGSLPTAGSYRLELIERGPRDDLQQ